MGLRDIFQINLIIETALISSHVLLFTELYSCLFADEAHLTIVAPPEFLYCVEHLAADFMMRFQSKAKKKNKKTKKHSAFGSSYFSCACFGGILFVTAQDAQHYRSTDPWHRCRRDERCGSSLVCEGRGRVLGIANGRLVG